MKCLNCNNEIPSGRKKFCSDKCGKTVWQKNHPWTKYRSKHHRDHCLTTKINGVYTKLRHVNKLPYPLNHNYQLCGQPRFLAYHHFGEASDNKLVLGIWICKYCHPIAEAIEKEYINTLSSKYLSLRKDIIGRYSNESGL